uniref:Uncharacterized protein n=1 Tax=Phaeomonas parva TaxID=124430 RepID=A0A6U4G5L2_9STRA|mmetsp:Transcript_27734/g.88030  ORF Transcript_27734/g.88030 Transcript_27734/m.88030 type:complete len:181 (+) Transcript_27734:143-685(+)
MQHIHSDGVVEQVHANGRGRARPWDREDGLRAEARRNMLRLEREIDLHRARVAELQRRETRYPKIMEAPPSTLQQIIERHGWDCEFRPARAHVNAACASLIFGLGLGVGRGTVFAMTVPGPQRLRGFFFAAKSTAPLYCIPFLLGSQYDCWRTRVERQERRRGTYVPSRDFGQHDAADLV